MEIQARLTANGEIASHVVASRHNSMKVLGDAVLGGCAGFAIAYFAVGIFQTHRAHRENESATDALWDRKAMWRACWQMAAWAAFVWAILQVSGLPGDIPYFN